MVSQDDKAITLRRSNVEDTRVPQDEIRRAGYLRSSLMPEGLLDTLNQDEILDMIAYLRSGGNKNDKAFAK